MGSAVSESGKSTWICDWRVEGTPTVPLPSTLQTDQPCLPREGPPVRDTVRKVTQTEQDRDNRGKGLRSGGKGEGEGGKQGQELPES